MFRMALVPPTTPPGKGDPDAIGPLDDYIVVVMETSYRMEYTDVRFRVTGFGLPWPVGVSDLSMCVEDLPDALEDLREEGTGVIWFAAQGIQRQLHLHDEGERIRIRCVPGGYGFRDTPDPADEYFARADFDRMVRDLAASFADCVLLAVPEAAVRPVPRLGAGRV